MSVNSQGINTSSINSLGGMTNTSLYPNVINIRIACATSKFLAIRYLIPTGIIGGIRSTAVLIKKDSTNFNINSPKISMTAALVKVIPIEAGVILLPVPVNNRVLSYIGANKPLHYCSAVAITALSSAAAVKNLSSSLYIKNNCNSILFSKVSTSTAVASRITCTTALASIKKLNIDISTNVIFNNPTILRAKTLPFNIHVAYGNSGSRMGGAFGVKPNTIPIQINALFDIKSILFDKAPPERAYIVPADYRYIVIPEEIKIMEVFKKQPADSYDYDFTYNEWLMGQDWVEAVSIQTFPNDATDVDGLQVSMHNLQGGELKLWISGGKNGVTYKVTLTATTKEHRIKQNEFKLKVKDI